MTKRKATKDLLQVGRPSKLTQETFNQIDEYLNTCGQEQAKLPSIVGLARHLNVNKDTIYTWSKVYPELSDYLKKIADRQQEDLMNAGLYGGREVNAGMAVFLLKALHGLHENEPSTLIQVNIKPILGTLDPS
jgi:hypothetical protein